MDKTPRLTAAKTVAQRKALMVLKNRYANEVKKIEEQLKRPLDVQLQVPKEIVHVAAPNVSVDSPIVNVTVPENAIQVNVKSEAPTVNAPVNVTIPENAIQVTVHVKADAPIIPPQLPPPITFSPQIPEPKQLPARKTLYKVIRHRTLNWIEGIEATEQ